MSDQVPFVATVYEVELWDLSTDTLVLAFGPRAFSEGFRMAAEMACLHDPREPLAFVMQGPHGEASRLVLTLGQLHRSYRRHYAH